MPKVFLNTIPNCEIFKEMTQIFLFDLTVSPHSIILPYISNMKKIGRDHHFN